MAIRALVALPLLMGALFLSGCTASTDGDTTEETANPCPGVDASSTVAGWSEHGGEWGRVGQSADATIVCGHADKALSSLVQDGTTFTDLEAKVSFKMLAGDSGAGLVLHFTDEQNFNIVRYSPREQGWHLFTVIAGNRQKQDEASVAPPTTNPELDQWVHFRVTSQDGHVQAFDGTTKVIDYMLPAEASHSGQVGYFLRDTGMAAYFDGYSVLAK